MPDYSLERSHGGTVAGIDEVGRGPLAGPVLAAAVVLRYDRLPALLIDGLDDSKALAPARRLALFEALQDRTFACIGVGAASVAEIDRINILQASHVAMRRAVAALGVRPDLAIVDGNRTPALPCAARAVVGGDASCLSIAAASVVAKVVRDGLMARLARRYAAFGWERNAGYPTPEHLRALAAVGPTRHHRRSFAPVAALMPSAARPALSLAADGGQRVVDDLAHDGR